MERNDESVLELKEVMLEAGLEDIEKKLLFTTSSGKASSVKLLTELKNDEVGASYLKTAQSVSFSEMCTFTVELPTLEHWRPEVKVAKRAEIKNLQDYETFIEVKDEGQTKVGSR